MYQSKKKASADSTSEGKGSKSGDTRNKVNMVKSNHPQNSIAIDRWKILKKAIVNKSTNFHSSKSSVRRFDAFGFVKLVKMAYTGNANEERKETKAGKKFSRNLDEDEDEDDDDVSFEESKAKSKSGNKHQSRGTYDWYSVSIPSIDPEESVTIRFFSGPVGLNDLVGFNNTGNICLWPSEEIMTYFCMKNIMIFDDKSVCELGGGMTCLGGLMISKFGQPKEVFLTDGNESSFENLEVICSENEFATTVECCLLQWSKETNYGDLEDRFDYIICADCLFFDEFREDLCLTIYKLLKMEGTCLIFAPNRQNTFHKFVDMAKLNFDVMIVHDYDMEVWEKHLAEKESNPDYDEDIHYPMLLKLKKRTRSSNDFCKMVL